MDTIGNSAKSRAIGTVDTISDLGSLGAIAHEWEALHRADQLATVFTSPAWLRGRLSALTDPWCVLVARQGVGEPLVGLLPLRFLPPSPAERISWATERVFTMAGEEVQGLGMAGSPLADYTGFVCSAGYEEMVFAAFADHIQSLLEWRYLEIHDVLDSRLDAFLNHFPEPRFQVERHPPTPCPFLKLTDTWDAYLATRPRPRMRREIRHDLRTLERLPSLRRTSVVDDSELQISTLLALWQGRWGALPERQLTQYRAIFRSCLESGCLWLDILWDRDTPIAGLLAFLDHKQRSFCFYITGFDERYAALSPGTVIVAHAIREAIRGGYRVFDFLRGDEPYKFALGAEVRQTENVTIHRATDQEPRELV
ncbi:MAG: GNAT family N-acetyltransferase [Deltaproteobacteria bacterium]|nr:GNAT family N-acetyltransferase [Deltaproteobacteria bacterium]